MMYLSTKVINIIMQYTVYQITNNANKKIYIGCHKTDDINDGYMGSGKILLRAYEKYGIENFTKKILHIFDSSEEMFATERMLVNEEFVAKEHTYNLKMGGFGGWDHCDRTGSTRSLETRTKISKSLKGNMPWNQGKKHSVETKRKIGLASKGRKHSQETLKKISDALKGRDSPKKGTKGLHTHSAETRKKMSESAKKRWQTGNK